ncbi:MAG: hypothetical protein AB7V48_04025 [Sedimentibacter sp.]
MSIEEMINVVEKYLEEAGFEKVREKYLNSKSNDEIKVLYDAITSDSNKNI